MINNLKSERIKHNLHQKDLAAALGVSTKIIYNWEHGTVTPSIRYALLLSHYLNVPVEQIYSIEDEMNGPI